MTNGPLVGVKVLELGVWVAAPSATGLMADWGATVIKVEPPTGDPQRGVFSAVGSGDQEMVPPFEVDNRGKRSVVLDLRSEEGMATMHRLLGEADVFVTNLRVPALTRLGLDPGSVSARYPRCIYGLLTGYGSKGPDAGRAAYDVGAFWARSGLAHTLVPPGESPPPPRSGQGDHTTGLSMCSGVMAALFDRERTGKGRVVETSLLRTGIYTMGWDFGIQLRFGRRTGTRPRINATSPQILNYVASDGRGFWLIGLEGDRHWPGLLAAIGREDLLDREGFRTARERSLNSEAVIAELDAHFATQDFSHWAERFDAHDVWWAPINSIPEAIVDPQAVAAGSFVMIEAHPGGDPYPAVNSPVDFSGYEPRYGRVPRLGEHPAEW